MSVPTGSTCDDGVEREAARPLAGVVAEGFGDPPMGNLVEDDRRGR